MDVDVQTVGQGSVRPSSAPASVEPSLDPHSKSYMEVMGKSPHLSDPEVMGQITASTEAGPSSVEAKRQRANYKRIKAKIELDKSENARTSPVAPIPC